MNPFVSRFSAPMRSLLLVASFAGSAATACSSGSEVDEAGGPLRAPSTKDGAGAGDGGLGANGAFEVGVNEVGLKVVRARQTTDGGWGGDLELVVTLANGSRGKPLPLMAPLFRVKTKSGILYRGGSGGAVTWIPAKARAGLESCAGNAEVGPGAQASCILTFDTHYATDIVEVAYATPGTETGLGDQRTATATFTTEACAPCGTACTYLDVDPDHCGACDKALLPYAMDPETGRSIDLVCVESKPACKPDAKTGATTTFCTTSSPTESGTARCVDVSTSNTDCGACGNACAYPKRCKAGTCK
ncbi:MAG: hypothetical protein U0169_06605 [Polyangiaceae bacterium]